METASEGWVKGLIDKYPVETLRLLAALCEAGLKRGEASANDLSEQVYPHPNVVGAVFKTLRRVGFEKTDRIMASTRPASHASFVLVWRLVAPDKATAFLMQCRSVLARLTGQPKPAHTEQGELPL